jgi:DNA-binding PadR family transcriptional regulator
VISKELVAASSRPLVLSILSESENYGYAILQRVRTLSEERIQWTDGMLYPVLHRLAAEGLVEATWKMADNGRERKYYRLTTAGHEALGNERRQWLTVHQTLDKLWTLQATPLPSI